MNIETTDNYFALYCDLLGFSESMQEGGSPLIFDYYGATWIAAGLYPEIRIYLFSDSIAAFVREEDVDVIWAFITYIVSHWSADGLLYQCFLGHGTFFEGRANFGRPVPNFFGAEIDGTALVDAASLQKNKPLGARTIISERANSHLQENNWCFVLEDRKGCLELFLRDNVIYQDNEKLKTLLSPPKNRYEWNFHHYLNVIYGKRPPRKRAMKHHIWSIASCLRAIEKPEYLEEELQEAESRCSGIDISCIRASVNKILRGYKPVPSK